jgi:prevent-host-death family protein
MTIHEAKTNLSRLIREAVNGEEVVISKGKNPIVKIVPVEIKHPELKLTREEIIPHFYQLS